MSWFTLGNQTYTALPVYEQITLMNWFFLVNKKHRVQPDA